MLELCSGKELISCPSVFGTGLECPLPLQRGLLALGAAWLWLRALSPVFLQDRVPGKLLARWVGSGELQRGFCIHQGTLVRCGAADRSAVGSGPTGLLQPCVPPGMGASMPRAWAARAFPRTSWPSNCFNSQTLSLGV